MIEITAGWFAEGSVFVGTRLLDMTTNVVYEVTEVTVSEDRRVTVQAVAKLP